MHRQGMIASEHYFAWKRFCAPLCFPGLDAWPFAYHWRVPNGRLEELFHCGIVQVQSAWHFF